MSRPITLPRDSEADIARLALENLLAVVRIDSQSDEFSPRIPSTEGQSELAALVAEYFQKQGAAITRDPHAGVIASFPGRGTGAGKAPVAFMVHLDTSRGTRAVKKLNITQAWQGGRIPYPQNPRLQVDVNHFPEACGFLGHDLVFGPGDAPFGLDDKLGLAHLMTTSRLLAGNPELPHPPLLFIGRPDEEIGRMAAVEDLASALAARGVAFGYTVDGILPFEVNTENFNASLASVSFPFRPLAQPPGGRAARLVPVTVGGVNTHGCTAKAEGYRAATRLAAEILGELERGAVAPLRLLPVDFVSDTLREGDGTLVFLSDGTPGTLADLENAVRSVVGPHLPRGAHYSLGEPRLPDGSPYRGAALDLLHFLQRFFASRPGFVLPAEESEGRQGYSNPFRALSQPEGLRLDFRLRDFETEGLRQREHHLEELARPGGFPVKITQQYINMGPRMAGHSHLVGRAREAGDAVGIAVRQEPIRGGTGVDPFLERRIPLANLGTGYFAPESEKEFTSLQMMARHALWLTALVQVLAARDQP